MKVWSKLSTNCRNYVHGREGEGGEREREREREREIEEETICGIGHYFSYCIKATLNQVLQCDSQNVQGNRHMYNNRGTYLLFIHISNCDNKS